jgi:hypothetical protein
MFSATLDNVAGVTHASQAAPAVVFKAKTRWFSESTITFEPSGRELTTKEFEFARSTNMVDLFLMRAEAL